MEMEPGDGHGEEHGDGHGEEHGKGYHEMDVVMNMVVNMVENHEHNDWELKSGCIQHPVTLT